MLRVAVLLMLAAPAVAFEFGYARVKGSGGSEYGSVTLLPFAAARENAVPMFLLAEPGDFARPWLRAKAVSRVLPHVVELMVSRGDVLKVGVDLDGNPALFVGPADRPPSHADLQVVEVLPGDAARFAREKGESRKIERTLVAEYWRRMLDDFVTVFVRLPVARDAKLGERLNLGATRTGTILRRLFVEVQALLKFADLTLETATPAQVKAKLVEVLQAMTPEQWAQLTGLAFRIPADFETGER
jgi:hypothetical protein